MSAVTKYDLLRQVTFGQRTAEEEKDQLQRYFVETEYWRRVYQGNVDIVYGDKGTGKSAIYLLILDHENALFDHGILLTSAENIRGAPAFQDLVVDPPATEPEFVGLWKLYFLTLIGRKLREFDIREAASFKVQELLESIGLLDREMSLRGLLSLAKDTSEKQYEQLVFGSSKRGCRLNRTRECRLALMVSLFSMSHRRKVEEPA